jgi:hypothetical protein
MIAMMDLAADNYPSPTLFQTQVEALVHQVDTLTDKERLIAEIWAGSTPNYASPPGKNMILMILLLASQSYPLRESVAIVGGTTFCLFHAAICAWKVKYHYMQARPIQIIREQYLNRNILFSITKTVGNGGFWLPYQASRAYTPPFPDYISGHSTFSMSACAFLRTLLKSDALPMYQMIDPSYLHFFADIFTCLTRPTSLQNIMLPPDCSVIDSDVPPIPVLISWTSWTGMANEAGMSRIYGQIHWHNSNMGGLAVGQWVSDQIFQKIDWSSLHLEF